MPITHIAFLFSCLAISGIPPFSGFFSKDEILSACFAFNPIMGWIMTAIAAMTAFYMFRLYYGIFWGKENIEHHTAHKPHEAPATMTIPLIILSVITFFIGWTVPFGHFISSNGKSFDSHLETSVAVTSVIIALLSIFIARTMYRKEKQVLADSLQKKFKGLWTAAHHRFYIDEVYQFVTHRVIFGCVSRPIAWFDRHVVDGFFNFLAWSTNAISYQIRGFQSGEIQQYTYVFLIGTLLLILLLIL
jgi:NADH-quinone oxidoreductase subunit L